MGRILWDGIGLRNVYCEQVQTFSKLGRHPLGRVVTVAYYSLIRLKIIKGGPSDCPLVWKKVDDVGKLPLTTTTSLICVLKKLRRQLREHPVGFIVAFQKIYPSINFSSFMKLYSTYHLIKEFPAETKLLDAITDTGEVERDVRHRPASCFPLMLKDLRRL